MYLIIGVLLLGIITTIVRINIVARKCLRRLGETMPLNEWISFEKAVELGGSNHLITQRCIDEMILRGTVEIRPTKKLNELVMTRAEEVWNSLPPEARSEGGMIVRYSPNYHDIPLFEFRLVRRTFRKVVTEKVPMPDFALPQAI